jgi:uncharacterized repeat protein (TIGR03847 family)
MSLRRIYNLDEVDRFILGTVGQPGEREFYIQVKKAGQVFSFALEKAQAQALTDRFKEMLREVKSSEGAAPRDNEALDMPIDSEFTLGVMALTWQIDSQMIRFEGQAITGGHELASDETEGAPAILRIRITPSQARSFIDRASSVIKAGRPPCMFCGAPINPDGHICPRMN